MHSWSIKRLQSTRKEMTGLVGHFSGSNSCFSRQLRRRIATTATARNELPRREVWPALINLRLAQPKSLRNGNLSAKDRNMDHVSIGHSKYLWVLWIIKISVRSR